MKTYPFIGEFLEISTEDLECLNPVEKVTLLQEGVQFQPTLYEGIVFANIRGKVAISFYLSSSGSGLCEVQPAVTVQIMGYNAENPLIQFSMQNIGFVLGPFSENFEDEEGLVHVLVTPAEGMLAYNPYIKAFRLP